MNVNALLVRVVSLASSGWKAVVARVPRMSHPATGYLLVLAIVGGVVLRIQNVGYPLHYMTPWGFAIILVAGVVSRLDRRFPKGVLVFVFLVLAVSTYFAPVWAEIPISVSAAHRRLIFPLWQ